MLIGPHGTWTAEDGSARQVVEVVAEALGPRRWGRAFAGRRPRWPGPPNCHPPEYDQLREVAAEPPR